MLTDDERRRVVQEIIDRRTVDHQEPITLEEEAAFNGKLAEFLSRADASIRCETGDRGPCFSPQLVPVCRRVETGLKRASTGLVVNVVIQRYRCLHCGAYAVAAIERGG